MDFLFVIYQKIKSGSTILEESFRNNHNVSFYSDPLFFNDNWLSKIACYDQMANWRLKANNLRKIYRRLSEYYTDQLGAELTPEWLIDTSRIGKVRRFFTGYFLV